MNSNSVATEIGKQTGLGRSDKTKRYAQAIGRNNVAYATRFAGYNYSGDFHVVKDYGNTFEVICDSNEAKNRINDILQVLNNLGLEIVTEGNSFISFKIPENENKWYGANGRYRKGKWRLWKKFYPEDTYCLSDSEDENFEYKFTAYSPSSAKSLADNHIEQLEKGEIKNSVQINSGYKILDKDDIKKFTKWFKDYKNHKLYSSDINYWLKDHFSQYGGAYRDCEDDFNEQEELLDVLYDDNSTLDMFLNKADNLTYKVYKDQEKRGREHFGRGMGDFYDPDYDNIESSVQINSMAVKQIEKYYQDGILTKREVIAILMKENGWDFPQAKQIADYYERVFGPITNSRNTKSLNTIFND